MLVLLSLENGGLLQREVIAGMVRNRLDSGLCGHTATARSCSLNRHCDSQLAWDIANQNL
jgi:hypothetical protein